MSLIGPARPKPGVSLEALAASSTADDEAAGSEQAITGKALIFWDPIRPDHKLDAIDTDQITPSEDCVSESLETLDERWKLAAFRHLMPDFRARVHAGENFVVAGDRFAILTLSYTVFNQVTDITYPGAFGDL